jgi:hypothetical protein
MILRIERDWAKYPGWFATLPKADQVRLFADYRIEHEDPKERERRYRAAKRARFDKMRTRAAARGTRGA